MHVVRFSLSVLLTSSLALGAIGCSGCGGEGEGEGEGV